MDSCQYLLLIFSYELRQNIDSSPCKLFSSSKRNKDEAKLLATFPKLGQLHARDSGNLVG